MKYIIDDEVINGDELDVIEYMKSNEFDVERFETTIDYLKHVQQNIWKFFGKSVLIGGETEEEKCKNFVQQMIKIGMVKMEEDTE